MTANRVKSGTGVLRHCDLNDLSRMGAHVFCLLPAGTHWKIDENSSFQDHFSKPFVARLPVSIHHLLPLFCNTSVISRLVHRFTEIENTSPNLTHTKSSNPL